MKLYYSPAYCSQAVHVALREAGIAADLLKVDTTAARVEDGRDWRSINPRGYVPMLELEDGSRHTEVAALLQYVGDLAPASGLMPAFGSRERFEVLQWLTFISSELHKVFSPWLFHKETADSTRRSVKEKNWLSVSPTSTSGWQAANGWWAAASPSPTPTASRS